MNTSHTNNGGNDTGQNPAGLTTGELAVKNALEQYLNAEVDQLDFNVTSKLAAARCRALDQSATRSHKNSRWANWQTIAGGGAAMAVAITVGGQLYNPTTDVTAPEISAAASSGIIEDLQLLAAGDDLEFYQSIEFLEWLENNSS
jgi:hypothetical protein